ncbi:type I-E CRISPR-associated protein Cse1/CasA [Leptolyngbya sp. 7M]|uniref:type I-E CRISPR-associated protein Cse1/CasA n=1 Tax=Leptolyngbya sp. 7M TaxID=2812896 RepID=UPI001CED481E|nr:type I-E CRISPR-associated protein Cse1/CasA [Leptolyngbya sp. 7M]
MPQFDLRKEPWIPCATAHGIYEKSLVDVLTEAHTIRELIGDSPPVTIALHRLLLAILHRIYRGPQDTDEWGTLYSGGLFDADKIKEYFNEFADRFDLFHETYPFYQTTSVRDKVKDGAVIKLYFHSSNNATLFDHTSVFSPKVLTPAEAARLLVMIQAFDTGGQITGDNGADSAKSAPLIQSAVALIRGESLFETLMFNLHRYCGEDAAPFEFDENKDQPAWERDTPTIRGSRLPDGPIDLLTWQSRRVLLEPEQDENGNLIVRRSAALAGYSFPDGMEIHTKETMQAFAKSKDGRIFCTNGRC